MLEQTKTLLIFFAYHSICILLLNSWEASRKWVLAIPNVLQNQVGHSFRSWHAWLDGLSVQTMKSFFFSPILEPMSVYFACTKWNVFPPGLYIYSKPPPLPRRGQLFFNYIPQTQPFWPHPLYKVLIYFYSPFLSSPQAILSLFKFIAHASKNLNKKSVGIFVRSIS